MQILKKTGINNTLLILSQIFICILFLPYIWYGESIQIRVFDNLDSNVVWAKMAIESGELFHLGGRIEQMMNGVSTHSIYGAYDISLLIFYLFGIFKGYVICKFLMMLVAFWGMYLLLINYVEKSKNNRWILICVSLLYAILPFWSFSMHVAGLPFVFFALLNLRNGNCKLYNWLVLFIFAFCSSLVLTGFFVLIIFGCICLYDLLWKKKLDYSLFFGLLFLCLCYIVSHLPLFYAHFYTSNYVSIRTEFGSPKNISFRTSFVNLVIPQFLNGDNFRHRHAVSNHIILLIPIFITLILMIKNKKINKWYLVLLAYCCITSAYYGISEYPAFYPIRIWLWSILPLNTVRCSWLNVPFWYILGAMALIYLANNIKRGSLFVIICIIVQLLYSVYQQDYLYYRREPNVKFKDFYATKQYEDIKNTINKPQSSYKVFSLGIDPAISLYNGFYTVDGFSVDYSIDYKKKFRVIMENEMIGGNNFYDKWGARCYLLINETWYGDYTPMRTYIDRELQFNYNQMKSMGGDYIISANELNLEKNNNLILLGTYPAQKYHDRGDGAFWNLFLYQIK